jgi:hypothetical protein
MVSLEGCDRLPRHRSKNAIDRSSIIPIPLQLGLDVDHDLVRRQVAVTVNRTVVRIVSVWIVTPRWIPVARIPEIPASANKDDAVVVAAPPTPIMPLPVVISKRSILLPTKSAAPPIVRDRHISVSVNGDVGGVAGESPVTKVPITIDRDVILDPGLIVESRIAISKPRIHCSVRANRRVCVSLAELRIRRGSGTNSRVAIEPRRAVVRMSPHWRSRNAALRPDGRRSGQLPCAHRRDLRWRVATRASMDRCRRSIIVIVLFRLGQRRRRERYSRAY